MEFRYLTQEEVIQLGGMDMELAIQDVEEMFRLLANGECVLPSKVVLRWGGTETEKTRGHINAMPGYVGGAYDMAGIKWICGMYQNPIKYDLPAIAALTILNDPIKGIPIAVMDGSLISAMRTGAVSGVAAKYLAREDATTVGLVGAGAQGRTQLMGLETALPSLSRALVYDLREVRSQTFCSEMSDRLRMSVEVAGSADEIANSSDVVVAAVPASEPVFKRGQFREGCLFLEVGANGCEMEAIPEFDKVLTDNWEQIQHRETPTMARAKVQGVISDDVIYADLGEVVAGRKVGRENDTERIMFGAVGMGTEDIAVATRILRRAEEDGVGAMLDL